jgi:DNA-binding HxlR family transcriptional regulator
VNSIREIRSKLDEFGDRPPLNQLTGSKRVHLVRTLEEDKSACGTAEPQQGTSVEFALALIQGKWKIPILLRLERGSARLGQLRRLLPQASKKVLTQHLREMETDGLIVRTDLSDRVPHVEYTLSPSLGIAVLHLISALVQWSLLHGKPSPQLSRSRSHAE